MGIYNPPSQNEALFVEQIKLALNTYSTTYENFLLLGDFNMATENSKLQDLMDTFCLENLIKEPTCFKSTVPTTIDLIVINQKSLFMKSSAYESGLSDFHELTTTILTKKYKVNPRNILYRDYKKFDEKKFEDQLRSQLPPIKTVDYFQFHEIFMKTLDAIAPIKKKILCFNHNPFTSKALRKAIMVRSKLKNKYNKSRTGENWDSYKKQTNFCVNLLRKTKKDCFNYLNIKNITNNKAFWKTIKPYFSNKGLGPSSLILSEKNKIVTNHQDIANIMNNYFTDITSHLNLKPDQINHS